VVCFEQPPPFRRVSLLSQATGTPHPPVPSWWPARSVGLPLRIIVAAFFFLVVGPLWHLLATRVPLTFSRNDVGFQTLPLMPLELERAEAYRRKAAEYLQLAEHARKLVLLWDISNSRRGGEIWPMKSSGWTPEHRLPFGIPIPPFTPVVRRNSLQGSRSPRGPHFIPRKHDL
jgi:hypothetical protein